MATQPKPSRMTADEFLVWSEAQAVGRYELVGGIVVQMAAERVGHVRAKMAAATALGDAIAAQGGDPAQVKPVVPVQLIVDHSLAVECGGHDPHAFAKNRAIEDRRNEDRFHFIDWTKAAFDNVDAIITNAAGCGAQLKDYAHMMANTPQAEAAARFQSSISRQSSSPV